MSVNDDTISPERRRNVVRRCRLAAYRAGIGWPIGFTDIMACPNGINPSKAKPKTSAGTSPSECRRRWSAQPNGSTPR
jgi:hypothetical protein